LLSKRLAGFALLVLAYLTYVYGVYYPTQKGLPVGLEGLKVIIASFLVIAFGLVGLYHLATGGRISCGERCLAKAITRAFLAGIGAALIAVAYAIADYGLRTGLIPLYGSTDIGNILSALIFILIIVGTILIGGALK
jgi:uncharacterized membrane protein (DUF373 family)